MLGLLVGDAPNDKDAVGLAEPEALGVDDCEPWTLAEPLALAELEGEPDALGLLVGDAPNDRDAVTLADED